MTKLEKIGLDCILQLVIDAEMHFINSNTSDLSDGKKDTEWGEAKDSINQAIKLLTVSINDDS